MRKPNYDKHPRVDVPGGAGHAWESWDAIATQLRRHVSAVRPHGNCIIAIECYTGVFVDEICSGLMPEFAGNCVPPHGSGGQTLWIDTRKIFLSPATIDELVAPDLGGDDPLFGFLSRLTLDRFLSPVELNAVRKQITAAKGQVIVFGPGAIVVVPRPDILVYADLPRWEAQRRQRGGEISNLGVDNRGLKPSLQYKRAFFIDWRVCDRLKQETLERWDFLLDTSVPGHPKLVRGEAFRAGLAHCVSRPFRVVPFFDPGPWGGQWMKEVCDLDHRHANYAWCFDCVPEENSLLLGFGDTQVEVPAIDLIFAQPQALLGEPVYGRFGAEFPIRFDFLDTMQGGNLSLQVHPLTHYIQEKFGMRYTQDESYYLLDAKPGAEVYLGRKRHIEFEELVEALKVAQRGERPLDDRKFIARFPARKHDHFLIPAGTLHCSGRDCMVLEISATPYIFTFKLWDWGRAGLDGLPRPLNIAHGKANIQWERDEDYAAARLVNQVREVAQGDGWREERTGLHEAQFIETRRHWFRSSAHHDTGGVCTGSVNVLNLVSGEEAVVESPSKAFEPFVVHYAETFIVPAAVGPYTVRPFGRAANTECATIKAFVRCKA